MDHREATRITAVEKYLLGELPDDQRENFEEHFFSCAECSEQVRLGAMFQANARSLVQEAGSLENIPFERRTPWFGWNPAPVFGMATAVLAVVIGYQNFVQIPALRQSGVPLLSAAPAAEALSVRGENDQSFSRQLPKFTIYVRHEWEDPFTQYAFDLQRRPGAAVVATGTLEKAPRDLSVDIRPAGLDAGAYLLTVYGVRGPGEKTAVARIPLTLTD